MEPLMASIILFAGNYAPRGWAFCQGQILSIQQYSALFSLLGTTYGGDGQTTFALPDLRGRVPIGSGQGPGLRPYNLGEIGGVETVTLGINQIPMHNHMINVANGAGTTDKASGSYLANGSVTIARGNTVPANVYGTSLGGQLNQAAVSIQGGSQPHVNMQPYLAMNYIIALQGIFPSRN